MINYDLLEIHETSKSKVKKSLESLHNNYLDKIVEIIIMKVVDITNINVDEYLINFKFDSKFNLSQHEVNRILGEEEYIVPVAIKKNNINYLTLYIIIHLALIYLLSNEYIN